jgi:hypothetical protein
VVTVVTPTAYQQNLISLGPLAYWPLNETSGTTAFDLAGGYNGTYIGGVALAQPGVTNASFGSPSYSVAFDGASAYVDIPEGPFNITGPITLVAWVNMSAPPSFSDIIGHGDPSYRIAINGGAGQAAANDGNVNTGDATEPNSLVDGNWHMVAYTYDGSVSGQNGTLYVDGVVAARNGITAIPAGDDLDVWIGGAPDYGTTFPAARLFTGNIAHVAIYTQALSAADIAGLISGELPVTIGIAQTGSSITLTWSSGTLLESTNVAGPYTAVSGATSPYVAPISAGRAFYKVQTH